MANISLWWMALWRTTFLSCLWFLLCFSSFFSFVSFDLFVMSNYFEIITALIRQMSWWIVNKSRFDVFIDLQEISWPTWNWVFDGWEKEFHFSFSSHQRRKAPCDSPGVELNVNIPQIPHTRYSHIGISQMIAYKLHCDDLPSNEIACKTHWCIQLRTSVPYHWNEHWHQLGISQEKKIKRSITNWWVNASRMWCLVRRSDPLQTLIGYWSPVSQTNAAYDASHPFSWRQSWWFADYCSFCDALLPSVRCLNCH